MVARARSGESFRSIAKWLTNAGHPIGNDSLMRHLRSCVGFDDSAEVGTPQFGAALVATTLAGFFARWPSAAGECAALLDKAGAVEAGLIMRSTQPETMRQALASTTGTPAGELLEARALAQACRQVLPAHPAAARAVAVDLKRRGVGDLADAFLSLVPSGSPGEPVAAAPRSTTLELFGDL